MSIAGDTQPRVPGFNSYSETVLSPRRSGIAWSGASNPYDVRQFPTISGNDSLAIGSATASGGGIAISPQSTGFWEGPVSTGGLLIGKSRGAAGSNRMVFSTANPNVGSLGASSTIFAHSSDVYQTGTDNFIAGGFFASSIVTGNNCIGILSPPSYHGGANNVIIGAGNGTTSNFSNYATNAIILGTSNSCNSSGYGIGSNYMAIGNSVQSTAPSSIGIGYNIINTNRNAIAIGSLSSTDFQGQINICNARFAVSTDIATGSVVMYMTTTTAAATNLATGAGTAATVPTGIIFCTNNSTYIFEVDIVAKSASNAGAAAWNLKFAFDRQGSAATSQISALSKTIMYTRGTTAGWDVTATADTTNGRPNITVTGAAATTIRWVGNVKMTKVAH